MAAITAVLKRHRSKEDNIVASSTLYGGTYNFICAHAATIWG
ncbi:MAG: hypothetical protein R3E08_08520 [Thiotrichaceae bacterium]